MKISPEAIVRLSNKCLQQNPELRGSSQRSFKVFTFCPHTFSARSVDGGLREVIVHGLRASDFAPLE